jgi:hypothetical protein
MPRVEKTSGGRVYIRPLNRRFGIGDQADVDEEMAAYLTEERDDFERTGGDTACDHDTLPAGEACPNCDHVESLPSADVASDDLVDTLDVASDGSTADAKTKGERPDEAAAPEKDVSAGDESLFKGEDFSSNGWLDNNYQDRADAVRAGDLDDHLDEIEAVETSNTVTDAVADRRSELED